MAEEHIRLSMNRLFEVEILVSDPEKENSPPLIKVQQFQLLNPYSMLLSSVSMCTGFVLFRYAEHHGIDLEKVHFEMRYGRDYQKDCKDCEENSPEYTEKIKEILSFEGSLTEEQRNVLLRVSHHCPIYKILKNGIQIDTRLA